MINVKITKNSIDAEGHAENKYVCNTVSTLMWAMCVGMQRANAKDLKVLEGDGKHTIEYAPEAQTKTIVNTFTECFIELAEEFPKEIKLRCSVG